MIKKIAWETFKNTGDINAFMEFKQIEEIQKEIEGCSLKSKQSELENNFMIGKMETNKSEKPQQNL